MVAFPFWINNSEFPAYVTKACKEAVEEVFSMESIPEEIRDSVGRLRAVLLLWSWLYYDGRPEVSDQIYDAGFTYLKRKEAEYPELKTKLSPTQRVGKIMEKIDDL